jgi:hypothetical protein
MGVFEADMLGVAPLDCVIDLLLDRVIEFDFELDLEVSWPAASPTTSAAASSTRIRKRAVGSSVSKKRTVSFGGVNNLGL